MTKRILTYLLFSLLIPVGLAVLFYVRFRSYNTDIDANMRYIVRPSQERNDIIFIGSSMVWNLIDPQIIEAGTGLKAYNLGLEGGNIVYFNMAFRKYLQVHPKPAYIVMNVDYRAFDTDHRMFNFPCYVPYMRDSLVSASLMAYYPQYKPGFALWWEQMRLINSKPDEDKMTNIGGIFSSGSGDDVMAIDTARGFHPYDWHWGNTEHRATPFQTYCTPTGLGLLRQIIEDCRARGIRLILVCGPLYQDYHRLALNNEPIFDSITQIAKEGSVPFWRYTDIYMSRDTTYFYNFGHLNKTGATVYSKMIAADLKSYISDSTYVPDMETVYRK